MQEPDDPWLHRQLPDNEMPGCVAFEAVLASSADMVVFVSGMSVFRNGVDFTVEVRVRPGVTRDDDGRSLVGDIHGHSSSGDSLLLGVEFADGRRCANVGGRHAVGSRASTDQPQLWSGGGGGSDRSASASWFLSPLPEPAGFQIICAWPAWNLPETFTEVPGEPIRQAAGRARELWPWQPETHDREPAPPVVPPQGWFAEATRST